MTMKLYKISFDFDYALADIVETYNDADSLSLTSETTELLKDFKYDWLTEDSSVIPDIAIIMSELFCVDNKAFNILKPNLPDIMPAPISIGADTFYSLSNIHTLKGVLNLKSSKVKYFSTGDIMEITNPVFKEQEYPNLFKVDEMTGSFFCTENFKDSIVRNQITGLIFDECKIKSKSWFRK